MVGINGKLVREGTRTSAICRNLSGDGVGSPSFGGLSRTEKRKSRVSTLRTRLCPTGPTLIEAVSHSGCSKGVKASLPQWETSPHPLGTT